MKNKNTFIALSLITGLIALVPFFLVTVINFDILKNILFGCMVITVFGIIFAFVGRKAGKGRFIGCLILNIMSLIITGLMFIGVSAIVTFTDCVEKDDGTVTCKYPGGTMEVPKELKDYLRKDQFKK